MKIKIFQNDEQLYNEIKNHIISEIRELPSFNLGLATGSTPEKLYLKLIEAYTSKEFDPSSIKTFNLDEYIGLEESHEASYHYYMQTKLFQHIPFKGSHVPKSTGNPEENVKEYNKLLEENPIDLQILGIGSNGHIAFNEPNTSFLETVHIATLTEKTIIDNSRFFNSIEEVPKTAITMGLKNIMNAKKIILIATGLNKADAIFKTVKGEVTEKVPASILQQHPNVTIYLDSEAASKL
ncbi:Glucosamine-6-phosphate deaminase NagB [Alteracholeplasma palmae J233]|uniref:Glucosamine-6-phosphate deaminase n=1 Tax=Alteracholeplasma palmae (strain ATCC 49389 / J233) TaxID=1318466 RepID=U4KPE1_ALTPJ|nr:glucosamine-6-phosphate deaminase [Alteracholeplasma palmae]CCV64100.1 Glucosamine-6-phosphate deaminase NagB [Alteracholeplasma palmae J233]